MVGLSRPVAIPARARARSRARRRGRRSIATVAVFGVPRACRAVAARVRERDRARGDRDDADRGGGGARDGDFASRAEGAEASVGRGGDRSAYQGYSF